MFKNNLKPISLCILSCVQLPAMFKYKNCCRELKHQILSGVFTTKSNKLMLSHPNFFCPAVAGQRLTSHLKLYGKWQAEVISMKSMVRVFSVKIYVYWQFPVSYWDIKWSNMHSSSTGSLINNGNLLSILHFITLMLTKVKDSCP